MKIDLLLKNAQVYNSYYKKFISGNVAILGGKVLYVDKKKESIFDSKETIECNEKYLIPGFIDIHMHIESTMTTPGPFCNTLEKYGVTTIISEPHEIANVFGIDGVNAMMEAATHCNVDVFHAIPSSVPSTNEKFETTGGVISFDDMIELSNREGIVCVGEVMNFSKVINDPELEICRFIKYIKEKNPNYIIEGHCPSLMDLDLAKFLYLGINGDHTEHNLDELMQRFENGMFVEIQEKMLHKDIIEHIRDNNLYDHCSFVTDDVMADDFVEKGHLNLVVKRAIELGMTIENAIYCATFTPAKRMNLTDRGAIAPGKIADILLIDDLKEMSIDSTYKNGKLIYNKSKNPVKDVTKFEFPKEFYNSVKLELLTEDDFILKANTDKDVVSCRVMEVKNGGTTTKEVVRELKVEDNKINWQESDCLLAVVFERYGKNNGVGFGLVTGECLKDGAVATTYAHDHHNLLVVGKNITDMVIAANKIIESQGGFAVVKDKNIIGNIELKVAGILSDESMDVIGTKVKGVKVALEKLGYNHYSPIMSLCTLSLPVSPELKITDKGLISVRNGEVVDIII